MLQEEFVEAPAKSVTPTSSEYSSLAKRFVKLCKPLRNEALANPATGLDRVLDQAMKTQHVSGTPFPVCDTWHLHTMFRTHYVILNTVL